MVQYSKVTSVLLWLSFPDPSESSLPVGPTKPPLRKAELVALGGSTELLFFFLLEQNCWVALQCFIHTLLTSYFKTFFTFTTKWLRNSSRLMTWPCCLKANSGMRSWSWSEYPILIPDPWSWDHFMLRLRGCGWTPKPSWRSTTTWSPGTPGSPFQDLGKTNGRNSSGGIFPSV